MFVKFAFFQPTSSPSSISFYRVNTTNGNTCILIRTDGLLSIQYRDKLNEDREADVYLPDNPTLSGMLNENLVSEFWWLPEMKKNQALTVKILIWNFLPFRKAFNIILKNNYRLLLYWFKNVKLKILDLIIKKKNSLLTKIIQEYYIMLLKIIKIIQIDNYGYKGLSPKSKITTKTILEVV